MFLDENNNLVDTGNVLAYRGESFFEGSDGDTPGLIILLRFEDKLEKGNGLLENSSRYRACLLIFPYEYAKLYSIQMV